ncbi:MAG: prolyl aminopeptidase [Pseudomonadales bacterium]|jgi:proline iminopeptidase|nr:prolyl aminopeptidase [Pseudomonadales bacterium]MDP7144418.1 prolyl aminopeptidase [Pseudomonadales bacterium]MDP7358030.1 prolyl aminopeptidase [Pseudomonadales bacterium]MDP7597499.1 prolyl aminopeptidase [Pseudomonadales bacterium]HJN52537.1 prolyl aminopeptidase [Pseudomonadales bacterium]|tara:strand:+ start:793 stop:1755 length:963 start_codon:yes stop_codon:yes gene_type:complete
MFPLYPEIKPYKRHRLKVDELHELYLDESGDVDGIPVLFVHDGPGSGCAFDSRRFFDPEKYRIVLFDQRGCGRSTPHGETTDNTLQHLIGDMEKIRSFLEIDRWLLFGGAWGSTLSLAYAETNPNQVLAMVLRSVFLARKKDVHWIYQDGASNIFPDHWVDYRHPIPASEHEDLVEAYHKRVNGVDELAKMAASKAWSLWEAQCASLHPNQDLLKHYANPHRAMARARLATHYFVNNCFLADDQLIDATDRIRDIPGIIVHGRFDMVSPLENAYTLHKAWLSSQLYIVREAGHAATEPTLIDALIRATRDMAQRFEADFQ